jgi:hypothetical protein
MRTDFQEEILKYILQTKQGKKYVEYLDKDLWDMPENQVVFDLFSGYVSKFNGIPSKVTLTEFFDKELRKKKEKISKEVYQAIEKRIYKLYETPFDSDKGLVHESIIEYAQQKKTKKLFRENADKVGTGDAEFFKGILKDMRAIENLANIDDDKEQNRGGFALADYDGAISIPDLNATPTIWEGLNDFTAAGGFYSPQLIVFMKGPKMFGTGVLLNLAKGFVLDGKKVYFADTENGVNAIKIRFYQALAECTRNELKDKRTAKDLENIIKMYKSMGGDFNNGFYPSGTKKLDDVDDELEYLWATFNWKPDVIIYDYLDLFVGPDGPKDDTNKQIQKNYHKAVALNNKWGTFAMTVSTVNRNAIDKPVIRVQDFGLDIQKAYNCHAAFAICATPDEQALDLVRIIPVAQRDGVQFKGGNVCTLKLSQAKMKIDEVNMDDIIREVQAQTKEKPRRPRTLTDD